MEYVLIEPLIDEIINSWDNITMYDIFKPIGQNQFKFHGILTWIIRDALRIRHFCDM